MIRFEIKNSVSISMLRKYEIGRISTCKLILLFLFLGIVNGSFSQYADQLKIIDKTAEEIKVGAQQTEKYFPFIKGKSIAVVAHPASLIKNLKNKKPGIFLSRVKYSTIIVRYLRRLNEL